MILLALGILAGLCIAGGLLLWWLADLASKL